MAVTTLFLRENFPIGQAGQPIVVDRLVYYSDKLIVKVWIGTTMFTIPYQSYGTGR